MRRARDGCSRRRDSVRRGVRIGTGYGARAVVLATGGRSLPKSGSDGAGYAMAARLGHGHVDTTPALAPLLLDGDCHVALSGVSLPARLTVRVEGRPDTRLDGALLWTHFGASGPVWRRMRPVIGIVRVSKGEPPPCCSVSAQEKHSSPWRRGCRRRLSSAHGRSSPPCWHSGSQLRWPTPGLARLTSRM